MVNVSRRLGPGPATIDGLRWLSRVGPSPIDAWACAMGWAVPTAKSHAARLKRERWIDRVARPYAEGSLIFATRQRSPGRGSRRPACSGASANLVGSSGGVRLGRCVADRPRARPGGAARADRGSLVAGRGESRARIAATGSHAGSRRHRARSSSGGDRGRAERGSRRLGCARSSVCTRGGSRAGSWARVSTCAGTRTSASSSSPKPSTSGSAPADGSLRVEMLETVKELVRDEARAVPRGTRLAKAPV